MVKEKGCEKKKSIFLDFIMILSELGRDFRGEKCFSWAFS